METKDFLKKLHTLAKQQMKVNKLCKELSQSHYFDDLSIWVVKAIYPNCSIKEEEDGLELYSADGKFLSNDGRCMDEEIPYFCYRSVGYYGDYYGTIFVKVDDENTFVAISYEC